MRPKHLPFRTLLNYHENCLTSLHSAYYFLNISLFVIIIPLGNRNHSGSTPLPVEKREFYTYTLANCPSHLKQYVNEVKRMIVIANTLLYCLPADATALSNYGTSKPLTDPRGAPLGPIVFSIQWRIQDFPEGGREPSRGGVNTPYFPENCMKSKEFGRPGGGVRPSRPP